MPLVFEVVFFNCCNMTDYWMGEQERAEWGGRWGAKSGLEQTLGHKLQCCTSSELHRLTQLTGKARPGLLLRT